MARRAAAELAARLGIEVDWPTIEAGAVALVKVLTRDPWSDAELEGLARASKVVDVTTAEAAAVERNRP